MTLMNQILRIKMLSRLLLLIFLIQVSLIRAQVDAGPDITMSAGLPVKLDGIYLGYTGIPVTAGDDPFVGPFEIGFSFVYFGEPHTQFAVSPNGLVSFDIPSIIGVSHQEITPIPNKVFIKTIMGPYQDLFSKPIQPHSQFIYYQTVGTAPERKLIVGWCEAPMFGCPTLKATYQIVLNETDNSIVNHILAKPECSYLQNKATHGLNYDNDLGVVVPGRNGASWSSANESWLFEPDGTNNYTISTIDFNPEAIVPIGKLQWTWYKNSYPAGEVVGSESSLIIYPTESTTYFAEVTLCNGMKYMDDVFVKVIPIPTAFNPNSNTEVNRTFTFFSNPGENVYHFKMYIYNRWGQLVFETEDISQGWDGTQNGTPCNPGVYIWIIYYDGENGEVSNKGSVTLIR
jgi:gliding motility-associated-like protein